jgi:ClpP class serine protease
MHEILKIAKYWAIEPDSLKSLCRLKAKEIKDFQSLAFKSDARLNNTRSVLIRDGTAIIPIYGPITARGDLFTFFLGGTPLSDLAKDFQAALDNDQVKAILFDVDSPGGVALGPMEMAQAIFNARGKKPIWSYVGRNCSSAAYWLASATEKIIANPSALLGSIGVVTTIPVQEEPDSEGYKNIEVVSSNAGRKRPDPRTAEGMAEIKRELDDLESQFIESVARFRSTTIDAVKNDFGQGGVLIGANAVASGMADEIGSYEETLAKLNQKFSTNKKINFMSKESIERSAITADFIKTEFPDIAEKLAKENSDKIKTETKESAFAAGIKSERERILAIEEAALSGHEDLVAQAKKDGNMTAEKLALQIISREKQRGTKFLESAKEAEKEMPKVDPSFEANTSGKEKVDKDAPLEERAKNEWQSDVKLRSEFADDYDAYFAFKKANEANQVKILSTQNSKR